MSTQFIALFSTQMSSTAYSANCFSRNKFYKIFDINRKMHKMIEYKYENIQMIYLNSVWKIHATQQTNAKIIWYFCFDVHEICTTIQRFNFQQSMMFEQMFFVLRLSMYNSQQKVFRNVKYYKIRMLKTCLTNIF